MRDQVITTQWLSSRESPYDLHQQPVVSLTIAALVGILAERFGELGPVSWMMTVSLALFLVIQLSSSERRQRGWILLLVGVAIACGLYSHSVTRQYDSSPLLQIATHDPQPCVVRAAFDTTCRFMKRLLRISNKAAVTTSIDDHDHLAHPVHRQRFSKCVNQTAGHRFMVASRSSSMRHAIHLHPVIWLS